MPSPFRKTPLLIFFSLLFAITLAWNIYLYFLPDHFQAANFIFNIIYGTPAFVVGIIILANIYRRQGGGKVVSSLSFLALGAIVFGLALYVWAYYNLVLKIPVPHPSVDEAFFAVYPFLLTIGTVGLLQFYTGRLNWRVIIEAVLVFLLTVLPLYYYLILPSLAPDIIWIAKFIDTAILIGNALLLSVVYLIIRVGGGRVRWLLLLYGLACLFVIAGQALFQYQTGMNVYWNGDFSDTLIAIHVFLFCLATIYTLDTVFGPTQPANLDPTGQTQINNETNIS